MDDVFEPKPTTFTISDYLVKRMILSPPNWQSYVAHTRLDWRPVLFSADTVDEVPNDERGVYSFVVQPGIAGHPACSYLLYVGKVETQVFRARYRQYLAEKAKGEGARRVHVTRMLQKWDGYLWFYYASIKAAELITSVEDALVAAYLPPGNREVPAEVRYALKSALDL